MSNEGKAYSVPEAFQKTANLTPVQYNKMYTESIANPEKFWGGARQAA